jgi:hypothetical protein
MPEMMQVVTTYGDLKDGETILDKSGNEWRASEVRPQAENPENVSLWLGTPPTHPLVKAKGDPVTVLRVPSQVEEVAAREVTRCACPKGRCRPRRWPR